MLTGRFLLFSLIIEYSRIGVFGIECGGQQDERNREECNFREFDAMARYLAPMTEVIQTAECAKQMKTFLKSLTNSSLWAVQMLDSVAKNPHGLSSSDPYDLGNYDECVEIDLKRDGSDNIYGQYCLARLFISEPECLKPGKRPGHDPADNFEPSNHLLAPSYRHFTGNKYLHLGVCFPNGCPKRDIENMLRFLYNNVTKINCEIGVWIPENVCATAGERNVAPLGTLISRTFVLMFFGVVLVTILEVASISHKFKVPGFVAGFILQFSAYKNYKRLVAERQNQRLWVVDSLKVYALALLTVIRRFDLLLQGPILNRKYADEVFDNELRRTIFAVTNDVVAAVILVISGFLHIRKIHDSRIGNPEKPSLIRVSLLQFLKSLSLYASAILFYAFSYEQLGDGPFWKEKTDPVFLCKRNFQSLSWFMSGMFQFTQTCISESWYFAVGQLHFLILTSFIVPMTMTSSTTGWMALGLSTIGTYLYMPDETIYDLEMYNPTKGKFRLKVPTTNQSFPYLIGVGCFLVYNKLKNRKKKKNWIFGGLIITILVLTLSVVVPVTLSVLIRDTSLQPTVIGTYKWRHIVWSLLISWLIIEGSIGNPSRFSWLLKHEYLTFFGFFTYPYILILGFVQGYTTGIARTLDYFSYTRLVWMSLADLVSTYIFSFVFYMMMHKPISAILEDRFLGTKRRGKKAS